MRANSEAMAVCVTTLQYKGAHHAPVSEGRNVDELDDVQLP